MTSPINHSLDVQYQALIRRIIEADMLDQGHKAPYYMYSGAKLTIGLDLAPLLLGRRVPWKSLEKELSCWIDKGYTKPEYFVEEGLKFYEGVCKGNQNIPYGDWHYDFEKVTETLRRNPSSKKNIMQVPSVWEDDDWYPGCIRSIQFFAHKEILHAHVYIRSSDVALGLPCDIWQMGQLTRRAQVECGFEAAQLNLYIANAHIYTDHLGGLSELVERPLAGLRYPKWLSGGYTLQCAEDYKSHPAIPFTFHK